MVKLALLCPTYKRPVCLGNVIACFLAQDYVAARLFILDDAGQFSPQHESQWELSAVCQRLPDLPAKFNRLVQLSGGWSPDAFVVWEDDDVYLPWHLSSIAQALNDGAEFVSYRNVWSNYGRQKQSVFLEPASGRFHASWSFTAGLLERVHGWPATRRKDFDQQLGSRLRAAAGDKIVEIETEPGYVYRWGNPSYHGSAIGGDLDWYDRVGGLDLPTPWIGKPCIAFDDECVRIYSTLVRDQE